VDPRNSSSWHEICDVCQSVADLNGVSVASYFSASDGACVIPGLQSTGPLGRYCAIFRSRPASWDILPNWDLSSVQAQIATDSANGIYPATLDGFEDNGVLRLASVSRSGPAHADRRTHRLGHDDQPNLSTRRQRMAYDLDRCLPIQRAA
jgi:hypothetical protein